MLVDYAIKAIVRTGDIGRLKDGIYCPCCGLILNMYTLLTGISGEYVYGQYIPHICVTSDPYVLILGDSQQSSDQQCADERNGMASVHRKVFRDHCMICLRGVCLFFLVANGARGVVGWCDISLHERQRRSARAAAGRPLAGGRPAP